MAEEQGTTAQAEETAQDQESAEQQSQAEETQETTEEQAEETEERPKTYDEDYVKELRKEAAGYRTRLSAAEKRVKQLEEGQDAEASAVREENDNLKTENQTLTNQIRRSNFIESIGLPNPRAAWGYILDGTVDVEYDDSQRPEKLEEVRKKLREEDPALFGEGSADGGSTSRKNGYEGAPGVGRLRHAYSQKEA